ncbi:MAG: radical SAM protein, partial [Clostridia bacterium]|nr:radical SAM protein [Clostridia bacterium]
MSDCKGIITEIQRFSVHDGPGIRTLVFLKGCPLRCQWCSNPETQEKECQTLTRQGKVETVGKEVTVKTIIHEVLKDNIYYRRSGGGITLSGGEPLFQPDFAKALLQGCKDTGINTAIETTGFAGYEVIESMIPFLDLVMYDVKHISSEKHRLFTGRSNSLILSNLEKLAQTGVQIIVRVPVVPTFNSTPEEMTA